MGNFIVILRKKHKEMESSFNTKENNQQMSALRASIANSTIILAA